MVIHQTLFAREEKVKKVLDRKETCEMATVSGKLGGVQQTTGIFTEDGLCTVTDMH